MFLSFMNTAVKSMGSPKMTYIISLYLLLQLHVYVEKASTG